MERKLLVRDRQLERSQAGHKSLQDSAHDMDYLNNYIHSVSTTTDEKIQTFATTSKRPEQLQNCKFTRHKRVLSRLFILPTPIVLLFRTTSRKPAESYKAIYFVRKVIYEIQLLKYYYNK